MEKERADAIVEGSEDKLRFAILLASVRAREAEVSAVASKESADSVIVELAPVVRLESKNGELRLSEHTRRSPSV